MGWRQACESYIGRYCRAGDVRHLAVAALAAAIGLSIGLGFVLTPARAAPAAAAKPEGGFQTSVPTAILLDPESDSILYEKNSEQPVEPASLAKLMTLEYLFNEIKHGRVKLDDTYTVSENAWRKGGAPSHGSTMFAAIHSKVAVSDLIQGIIVDSANDACIAVAEALAGNETAFGELLTKRAREIGLQNSTFTNATGLSDPNMRVTARDMAELARHIIQTYPDLYPLFAQRDFTWDNIHQQNRNPLLGMGIGADGLKTGETKEAGFNLVGSAVSDNLRLIVVITGSKDRQGARRRGAQIAGFGLSRFQVPGPVRRRPDRRRGQSVRRRPQLRAAGRPRPDQGDDTARQHRAAQCPHRLYRSGARPRSPRARPSAS